ncbi:MAG: response regulator [Deltaproteobacteria bacterium]|nr:response regulator [Deltaproteobacteria bacterium]
MRSKGAMLLVADDCDSNRRLMTTLLRPRFQDVVEARDGDAALRLLLGPDAPTLALLDWGMPGLDGLEVVRRVRALRRGALPYIIMVTGHVSREEVLAAEHAGANDYVTKPFRARVLLDRVDAALSALASVDDPHGPPPSRLGKLLLRDPLQA